MTEKVTIMVIKVDLQCDSCYKKVKKLLCKFPEIRDQIYDEKQNTVTITVLTCCPDRTRDKLCSKGGRSIKSVEIKVLKPPQKPKEPEKKLKEFEKPKEPEKKVKLSEKPIEPEKKPKEPEKMKPAEKVKDSEKKKEEVEKPKDKPKSDGKADKPTVDQKALTEVFKAQTQHEMAIGPPMMVSGYPTYYPSGGPCCGPCCNGYGFGEGPCSQVYGRPVPLYDNYGYGPYDQYANRARYVSPHEYFSDENPSACTIM